MSEVSAFIEENELVIELILIVVFIFFIWLCRKINRVIFKRIKKTHKEIHILFFEKLLSTAILIAGVILIFSVFGGFDSIWKTMLGGTAIISGVLAFAAQDAIKDILAGLMISMYKPFEIGNRIVLEDGTAGIVKDITMRHVVLQGVDTLVIIVPNSKLNVMSIKNHSYHSNLKSVLFEFHVAYGTDVDLAKSVIKQVITDSEYTVPKLGSDSEYGDVFFTEFEDSSYKMVTTAYYNSKTPTEVMTSDVNTRISKAFAENDIEIPFKYVNIIQK